MIRIDKILLIDSSEKSSEFMVRCLTRNGYDVLHMIDITGIAIQIKSTAIDMIIIDSEVMNESGFDVCRKLNRFESTKLSPKLIMSESESNNSLMRALEAGADDFIQKSFDEPMLISKVKSLMRIKRLRDQLIKQYEEIEEKNKILDAQLNMAMHVQRSLIREHDFSANDVRFMSKYMPALDIGGDFYDIIKLDDENIAVVMGDLSGHGISAALLTAMSGVMIRNLAPKYYNPAQFLQHMNSEFCRAFENAESQMYACVFYAVINTKEKIVHYSNAGQALPIMVRDENIFELEASGVPVGMMKEAEYEHKTVPYGKNDMILFYTDGLSDNLYKDNSEEFFSRLNRLLLETRGQTEPAFVIDALIDAFSDKNAANNKKIAMDDVSMILCKM